jgi:hypothetical protein
VHGVDGHRHAVVVMLNHPQAASAEARAVLDAVVATTLNLQSLEVAAR